MSFRLDCRRARAPGAKDPRLRTGAGNPGSVGRENARHRAFRLASGRLRNAPVLTSARVRLGARTLAVAALFAAAPRAMFTLGMRFHEADLVEVMTLAAAFSVAGFTFAIATLV